MLSRPLPAGRVLKAMVWPPLVVPSDDLARSHLAFTSRASLMGDKGFCAGPKAAAQTAHPGLNPGTSPLAVGKRAFLLCKLTAGGGKVARGPSIAHVHPPHGQNHTADS